MDDKCPLCGTQYGKRRRCYTCQPGRQKTGEQRTCPICGSAFYVQRNTAADVARNSGSYCSRACKHLAQRVTQPPPKWAKIDQPIYHSAGYVLVWAPAHPRANRGGRVLEHILVAEQKIGRPLTKEDHVHHIDGNRTNNDPDNLMVLSNADHQRLHVGRMNERRRENKASPPKPKPLTLHQKLAEYERRFGPLDPPQ